MRHRFGHQPRWALVCGDGAWILSAICDEIEKYGDLNAIRCANGFGVGEADYYFFAHFSKLIEFLRDPRETGTRIVFFPHFEDHGKRRVQDVINALHQADKVICMASGWEAWLIDHGLDPEKMTVVVGAADPQLFSPHDRSTGAVGFVSKYYPRKHADMIFEITRRMPDRQVILVGRGWDQCPGFEDIRSLPNFEYIETSYSQYPDLYCRIDVFVSVSRVEGGPIPLIEAMMSNAVPVASRTGFAPDVIRDGENGYLFDMDADADAVVQLIEKASELRVDVRKTVEHLTWENFSEQLLDFVRR